MVRRRTLIVMLLVAVLLGAAPALSVASPGTSRLVQEGELLKNPGFEGITCAPESEPGWCLDNWSNNANHDGSFHGNIFTPQGWVTWWREGGQFGQPEVKTIPNVAPFTGELNRIRSGNYAVLLFTFYRLQDTGMYQVVTGLEPGATVQLTAYAHGWSCDSDDKMGYTCGDPWNQRFQVGIEPNGAADPFSPNVVWSGEQVAPDQYTLIGPATAQVGPGGSVTAILRSKTKWAYKYQDAYWDDASMVMTAPGTPPTNTPAPPPPEPVGPPPTPRPTPTPSPDGSIIHTVSSGETLMEIAFMYGKELNEIRQLNAGSIPNDIIVPGQQLVIALPNVAPTPSPLPPVPTEETPAEVAEAPEGSGDPAGNPDPAPASGGTICVAAYNDLNADTFRDAASEALVPNAEFTLANTAGVVDTYVSDGVAPHCFTGLAEGPYRVIHKPAPGYAPSGPAEYNIGLTEGTNMDFFFGSVPAGEGSGSSNAADPGGEEGEGENSDSSSSSNESRARQIFKTVAGFGGIFVLIVAVATAVLFFVNRRQA